MRNVTTNSNREVELANSIYNWDGKNIHELKNMLDEFYELTGWPYDENLALYPRRDQIPEYLRTYNIYYVVTCDINGYCLCEETNEIKHATQIRAEEIDTIKFYAAQRLASMKRSSNNDL